jgi:hypothetical protein
MSGTKDNIYSLCELLELQNFDYLLLVVEPEKDKTQTNIHVYTSMDKDNIETVLTTLKKLKKNNNKDKNDEQQT